MSGINLYELSGKLIAVEQMVLDACDPETGEITAAAEDLEKRADAYQIDFDARVEGICRMCKNAEAQIAAMRAESKRLAEAARAVEARNRRVIEWLRLCMQVRGVRKTNAGPFRVSVQANGGALPVEISKEPAAFPARFQIQKIELDKKQIAEALAAGEEIPGAHLAERGEHIVIR